MTDHDSIKDMDKNMHWEDINVFEDEQDFLECELCGNVFAANKMYGLQCWSCSQNNDE